MELEMFFLVWGSELRRIREGAGLSQVELAKLLGTTQKQVSRCENGGNITLTTVHAWYVACKQDLPVPDAARE